MNDPLLSDAIPSPCYLCNEYKLKQNLLLMDRVQQETGVEILLALKGFAMWPIFDLVSQYLQGCTASSIWEAQLAKDTFGKQVHAYSPAYKQKDIDTLLPLVDHLSFNSLHQWYTYKDQIVQSAVSPGLRVNPEHSETTTPIYDPAAPGSRLGVLAADLQEADLSGLSGLHIHTLCECDAYATERTIQAVEEKFAAQLSQLKWINLGGGHLMTQQGYDVDHLVNTLNAFRARHPHLKIFLEPGSAVAWEAGYLIAEVVDIVDNQGLIAILDISATAHMPDVLEMPYRPEVRYASLPGVKAHTYKLAGNSCLAGDVINEYSFDQPLTIGQRIIFEDMLHYTMVKTTFFNGVAHPSIGTVNKQGSSNLFRQFGYDDFKGRLG